MGLKATKEQIKQVVRMCRWGGEWTDSGEVVDDYSYDLGGREAIGHMLSCWMVQVGKVDCYETAEGRDLVFTPKGRLRPAAVITRLINKVLHEYHAKPT